MDISEETFKRVIIEIFQDCMDTEYIRSQLLHLIFNIFDRDNIIYKQSSGIIKQLLNYNFINMVIDKESRLNFSGRFILSTKLKRQMKIEKILKTVI